MITNIYKTYLNKLPEKSLTDKCLVLDLDETLVHSHSQGNIDLLKDLKIFQKPNYLDLRKRIYKISMDDVVYKKGKGIQTDMWGITRPHLQEFLISCFSYFKIVAIWSAGRKKYVNSIVDFIFRDLPRPVVIWDYDKLERLPNNTFIKPLSKMINSVPRLNKYMSLNNTFIIDDRLTVFQEPNPNNGIQIPAYKPSFNITAMRSDDIVLKQLMRWFYKPEVMNADDVRTLNKSHIFYQPITSKNIEVK